MLIGDVSEYGESYKRDMEGGSSGLKRGVDPFRVV